MLVNEDDCEDSECKTDCFLAVFHVTAEYYSAVIALDNKLAVFEGNASGRITDIELVAVNLNFSFAAVDAEVLAVDYNLNVAVFSRDLFAVDVDLAVSTLTLNLPSSPRSTLTSPRLLFSLS